MYKMSGCLTSGNTEVDHLVKVQTIKSAHYKAMTAFSPETFIPKVWTFSNNELIVTSILIKNFEKV